MFPPTDLEIWFYLQLTRTDIFLKVCPQRRQDLVGYRPAPSTITLDHQARITHMEEHRCNPLVVSRSLVWLWSCLSHSADTPFPLQSPSAPARRLSTSLPFNWREIVLAPEAAEG